MRPFALLLSLLLFAVSNVATATERSPACEKTERASAPRATAPSKTDPEPGHNRGKVEDGAWQETRWKEKAVEARTERVVRSRGEGRVRPEPMEREVGVPDR
jgi:hypothetical protein